MGLLHRAFARSKADVWDTENRLIHAVGLVRRPVAAQWLVTAACDLKCPHCYSAAGRRVRGELTTEEAKRLVIDPLVTLGCGMLVLAGGELLLRRDIPELVEYAVGRGLGWAMHTHGLHVPRFGELFARHPPALAAISLDGDRSFHDAFRGRAGSFDAAFVAAEVLADAGCREVVFGTTITRDNADAVSDLFPLVASSRAHSWGLHLFAPEGRGHDHAELFPTPGQLQRVAAFARRRRALFPIELCNEWGSAGPEDLYYRDQPFTCGAGSISLVISATGDILPCTTTDPAEREGNVREVALPELWRRRFARFRSGSCLERGECWLQTRNDVRCAEDAFGAVARPQPLWAERLPSVPGFVRRVGSARVLGRRSSSAVGLAAAGLVFLQGCAKPARKDGEGPQPTAQRDDPGAPASPPWAGEQIAVEDDFPQRLADAPTMHFSSEPSRSDWGRFRQALTECERADEVACARAEEFIDLASRVHARSNGEAAWNPGPAWSSYLKALRSPDPDAFGRALDLLASMEQRPTYDPAIAAQLWRRVRATPVRSAADSAARARLFAALRRHHKVYDALLTAKAIKGPVDIRPWLKKSMPPPEYEEIRVPPGTMRAARRAFHGATATTWDTLGLTVTIRGGPVSLARAGLSTQLRDHQTLALGRLDVLFCARATTLRTAQGRDLMVPPGAEVTLFDLPGLLSDRDRTELRTLVTQAASGDQQALDAVQQELGVAHAAVRDHLRAHPDAAALSTLLVAFDE